MLLESDYVERVLRGATLERGIVTPIACGQNYRPYGGCYKLVPSNSELSERCFRTDHTELFRGTSKIEKLWLRDLDQGIRLVIESEIYQKDEITPQSGFSRWGGKPFGKPAHRAAAVLEYECNAPIENGKAILDIINRSVDVTLPSGGPSDGGPHSDCLLAERALENTSTSYWYDDIRFYCFEATDMDDAKQIVERYLDAFEHADIHVFRNAAKHHSDWLNPDSAWYYGQLDQQHLAYSALIKSDVRLSIIEPEMISTFYADTGADREIASGRTVVLLAIDAKFRD